MKSLPTSFMKQLSASLGAVAFTAGLGMTTAVAQVEGVPAPDLIPETAPVPIALPPGPPGLTTPDLEAWLDGLVPFALASGDLASAVIVVVKDGEILLSKGYGHADVAARTPVDPERTLFRVGSVAKLFTWTAVMQLVERGMLDLDADINQYLDFTIPPREGKPVTLRNLMTHSAGFEEVTRHLFARSADTLPGIGPLLKQWVPVRLYAPGEVPSYSNWGATLAGYVIERVSGMPFDDYMDQNLLAPLGMAHSTFRQPLPEALSAQMATGYSRASAPPLPFELVGLAPGGSLSATAADMARFMIAHLQGGHYQGSEILKPETARLMHATALQPTPPLNGMALGFYRTDQNGQVIVSHGGDTRAFHSDLNLILSQNVGLFISISGSGKHKTTAKLRYMLKRGFVDRYFPAESPVERPALDTARAHGELIAGRYHLNRGSHSNFLASLRLFGQFKVTPQADGTLLSSFHLDLADRPRRWREVEPFVWQEIGGPHRMAAVIENGKVIHIGSDDYPPVTVGLPVPAWQSAAWNLPLLIFTVLVLGLSVLLWPVAALVRRAYRHPLSADVVRVRRRRWMRAATGICFVFFAGWSLLFVQLTASPVALDGGLDLQIRALQLIGLLSLPAAVVALWDLVAAWRERRGGWQQLASIALAIACVATPWFAFSLRLATPQLNY